MAYCSMCRAETRPQTFRTPENSWYAGQGDTRILIVCSVCQFTYHGEAEKAAEQELWGPKRSQH